MLSKGGVRSSVFTLFSGTVGAGILSLPHVVSFYGVGLGFFFILCFAYITHTAQNILNDLIVESGRKSYANVCSHYLGKRNAKLIIQFIIFAQVTGTIIYTSISKSQPILKLTLNSLAVRRPSSESVQHRGSSSRWSYRKNYWKHWYRLEVEMHHNGHSVLHCDAIQPVEKPCHFEILLHVYLVHCFHDHCCECGTVSKLLQCIQRQSRLPSRVSLQIVWHQNAARTCHHDVFFQLLDHFLLRERRAQIQNYI